MIGIDPDNAHKMKFSIEDSFSKCDQNQQKTADLVTCTEEILNGKLMRLTSRYSLAHSANFLNIKKKTEKYNKFLRLHKYILT